MAGFRIATLCDVKTQSSLALMRSARISRRAVNRAEILAVNAVAITQQIHSTNDNCIWKIETVFSPSRKTDDGLGMNYAPGSSAYLQIMQFAHSKANGLL
jgi:hypothetical protein